MKYHFSIIKKENLKKPNFDVAKLRKIAQKSWADPGSNLFEKWLELGEIFCICTDDNGEIVGYTMAKEMSADSIYIVVTIIDENHKKNGIGKNINFYLLSYLISKRGFRLTPLFVIFRTMSPIIYKMAYKNFSIFPDYRSKRGPTKRELQLFKDIVANVAKNKKIVEKRFLIKNANTDYPQLNYGKDNIPWSNDAEINLFMDRELGLRKGSGTAMVITGKIAFCRTFIIYLYYKLFLARRVDIC